MFAIFTQVLLVTGLFYWMIVRPWILSRCAARLSRVRDDLHLACMNDDLGAEHPLAAEVLSDTDDTSYIQHLSFMLFAIQLLRDRSKSNTDVDRIAAMRKNAPGWLEDLLRSKNEAIIAAIVINSPLFWPVIFLVILGTMIFSMPAKFRENFSFPSSRLCY